jgi:Ca2+:H+ antiporter
VQPYAWIAAFCLFLSYSIGLWFTLRTHAALIWEVEEKEKKHAEAQAPGVQDSLTLDPNGQPEASGAASASGSKDSIRESAIYKKLMSSNLKNFKLDENRPSEQVAGDHTAESVKSTPHMVPPRSSGEDGCPIPKEFRGFSPEQYNAIVHGISEISARNAAIAVQQVQQATRSRKFHQHQAAASRQASRPAAEHSQGPGEEVEDLGVAPPVQSGGHDAPNWSRSKSSIVLLGATLLYAVIAEILVNTVDVVLESVDIDEKFLGITLFALVPNTTEFLVC